MNSPAKKNRTKQEKLVQLARSAPPALAREKLGKLIDKYPANARFNYFAGLVEERENNPAKAEAFFKAAQILAPDNNSFAAALARIYYNTGKFEQAASIYATLDKQGHKQAAFNLAACLLYTHKATAARKLVSRFLQHNTDAEALCLAAQIELACNNPAPALDYLEKATQTAPEQPQILWLKGKAYFMAGNQSTDMQSLGRENFLKAVACYKKCVVLQPDNTDNFVCIGNLYDKLDQPEQAKEAFLQALDSDANCVDALVNLGNLAVKAGDKNTAASYFDRALKLDPANGAAAHMKAVVAGKTQDVAPPKYVRELYDDYAGYFESSLVGRLKYNSPAVLKSLLDSHFGDDIYHFATAVDLGCGTGLMGKQLAAVTNALDGVDLSPAMLEKCRSKNIYTTLEQAEINQFAQHTAQQVQAGHKEPYKLVMAADVLIYTGDLKPLFKSLSACIAHGGFFLFSVESLDDTENIKQPETGFMLHSTGRFRHSLDMVETLLADCGFALCGQKTCPARFEQNKAVIAHHILAQRL